MRRRNTMTVYPERLPLWSEVIGKCEVVVLREGRIIARISGVDFDVTPRENEDELLSKLQELHDQYIGILATDVPAHSICVRVIETGRET